MRRDPDAETRRYDIVDADLGRTLRFRVTASNAVGSQSEISAAVGPVTRRGAAGCPPSGSGGAPVTAVSPPARLSIDRIQTSPAVVRGGTQSITVRVQVTACKGIPISGALVYVTAVPYNQWSIPEEQLTGADGWATLTMARLSGFPATPVQQLLVFFTRARKAGENILGGISNRRLVSTRVQLR